MILDTKENDLTFQDPGPAWPREGGQYRNGMSQGSQSMKSMDGKVLTHRLVESTHLGDGDEKAHVRYQESKIATKVQWQKGWGQGYLNPNDQLEGAKSFKNNLKTRSRES